MLKSILNYIGAVIGMISGPLGCILALLALGGVLYVAVMILLNIMNLKGV